MLKDIVEVLPSYLQAIRLIKDLRLQKYIVIPGLIGLALGGLVIAGSYVYSGIISAFLIGLLPWMVGDPVSSIVSFIVGASMALLGLLFLKYILLLVVGPFMSPLSERIESYLTGKPMRPGSFDMKANTSLMLRGLRLSLRNIFRELLYVLPLLVLGLIPGVGLFTAILIFMIQAYYAGFGNLDFTLERHYNVDESIDFAKRNKALAAGNGSLFLLLLMVPVLGLFIAPALATTAGTIQFVKKNNLLNAKQQVVIEIGDTV